MDRSLGVARPRDTVGRMQTTVRSRAGVVAMLALSTVLLAACGGGNERVAEDGDQVSVHYTGTLDNGEQFDSSIGRDPLPFQVGAGGVIDGFDAAVRGLAVGESVTVRIEPAEAYGVSREDLVVTVPRDQAPDNVAVGQEVMLGNSRAVVIEVTETEVRVDANHPLAGEALTFEIELVSIAGE